MAGNTTWVHMGSEAISKLSNKTSWPLSRQLVYKRRLVRPYKIDYHFFSEKLDSPL